MNIELEKARAVQRDACGQPYLSLEADYALLAATQAAIEAQTNLTACVKKGGKTLVCSMTHNAEITG